MELRNQTDSLLYQTERALAEQGDALAAGDRAAVEQALNEARDAVKGDDVERMRRAQEGLNRAAQTLTEAAHRKQTAGGNGGGAAGAGTTPDNGEVVDAEFRDADDRKP